jgi:hypothetical protein
MTKFAEAPRKREGAAVSYDTDFAEVDKPDSSIYIERRVPVELEDEVNALITDFLRSKGYD